MAALSLFAAATSLLGAPAELASLPVGVEVTGYRSTHAFTATRLSDRPGTFLLRNFLTAEECEALMTEAEASGELHLAETSGRTDARKRCDICCLGMQSPTVAAVTKEAAGLLLDEAARQMPGSGCEDLHMLRYDEGGEFMLHYDATSVPRVLTVLYYVNGVGSTWFPFASSSEDDVPAISLNVVAEGRAAVAEHAAQLDPRRDGLLVEPGLGDALAFYNFHESGVLDPFSLHAGMPACSENGSSTPLSWKL